MTLLRTILKITVLSAWLFLLYQLYERTRAPSLASAVVAESDPEWKEPAREYWMGVYFKDKKIGYTTTTWAPNENGYEVVERAFLSPKIMGEKKEIRTATRAALGKDYVLQSVDFKMESGPAAFHLTAKVEGKRIHVVLHAGTDKTEQDIALVDAPRLPLTVRAMMGRRHIRPGDKYRVSVFDPSIVGQAELVVEVLAPETVDIGGQSIEAFKVHETIGTVETWSWVTEDGETVKEESPMGFTTLRESREEALYRRWPKGEDVDLIVSTAIPVSTYIAKPSALKILKLRLRSPHLAQLGVLSDRQTLSGNVLTIAREIDVGKLTGRIPIRGRDLAPFLAPEVLIPSDDQELKLVSRGALGAERAGNRAARRLAEFVFEHLEKTPLVSIPDAKQVLHLRKGDCNEHAVLFAALARAAGIPAKVAVGIVYTEGSFFYHAWNEVYLRGPGKKGRWVTVDSTFNQIPADVTHVKMAEGGLDKQIQVMSFVGNLSIEVLETGS